MVGYVIGLGDRHPGNILIEQTKFNAISIDFGDVFEAAAERSAFPEHVPFRLTPEIFNAFEASRNRFVPYPQQGDRLIYWPTIVCCYSRRQSSRVPRSLQTVILDYLGCAKRTQGNSVGHAGSVRA